MGEARWCLACGVADDSDSGAAACPKCGQRLIPRAAFRRTGLDSLTPHTPPALRPPEVDRAAADPGAQFDRFILVEEIGAGGAGTVYRAWDSDQNRFVALKVLRDSSPTMDARFSREAYAATRLSHPNIVKVHHHGVHQGRPFIAMEWIRGRTLAETAADRPPLDARMALFATICDAVHHAHVNGIVHRDLKPANILVDGEGHPFIVDFGLSRPRDEGWTLTLKDQAVGTPQYMSPEQTRGGEAARQPATDVYSLGAVLYHLLTGRAPFTGDHPFEIMARVAAEPPMPPRRIDATVPAELETISMKCLEKEPERRYASAADVAEDIGRWRRGEPIRAKPLPAASRLWRQVVRRRAMILPAVAALAAIAIAGVSYLGHAAQNRAQREAFALIEGARPAFDEALILLYSAAPSAARVEDLLGKVRPSLRQAIDRCPPLPHARFALGRSWSLAGRDDLAEPLFRQAVDLDPRFAPALFELGRIGLDRAFVATIWGNAGERSSKLGTAASLARQAGESLSLALDAGFGADDPLQRDVARAMQAYTRDDQAAALEIIGRALTAFDGRPGSEEFHLLRAVMRQDAEKALARAVAIRPGFAKARLCLGALKHLAGDYRGAVDEYDRAIESSPRSAAAFANRGIAKHQLRDAAAAEADHSAAIGIDAGFALAWVNRGAARADLGRIVEGIADYTEAIRLDPSLHQALAGRSALTWRQGDLVRAHDDIDRAIKLSPTNPDYFYIRGDFHRLANDRPKARADLMRALELAPQSWPRRETVSRMLKALGPADH